MIFFKEWNLFPECNFFVQNDLFFLQNEMFFTEMNFFYRMSFCLPNEIFSKEIQIFFLQINNFIFKKKLHERKYSFCKKHTYFFLKM